MKDLLLQYYNLSDSIELVENENFITFVFNDKKYYFCSFLRSDAELDDLLKINEELILKDYPTARFVKNKNNQIITLNNDEKFVLLEFFLNTTKEFNVLDMINFNESLVVNSRQSILYRNSWGDLWASKIDYFEYQVAQLGKNKPIILNSFSYYVGLAENAVSYVNNTIKNHKISILEHVTLQRKRISFPNIQLNYFNPLNYVIDIEVRDIASYFKSLFFNSYDDLWIEVKAFLKRKRLSIYGYQLLYARLLYPSYYFDIYEKVIEEKINEEELLKVINKVDSYELFLKNIFLEFSKIVPIEPVDWILKKKES